MKKILFICPSGKLDAGGEFSNHQLILYLVRQGYEVRVITSWRGHYNDLLTKLGIKNQACDYNWWTDNDKSADVSVMSISGTQRIVAEIKLFNPHIVITNTLVVPWGALAAAITDKPHIWIAREFPQGDFSYLHNKMGFIQRYSNIVMANSRELASYVSETYGFPVGHFYSYVESDGLELDKTITETRIVSPNYINNRKNQLELIQALAILRERNGSFSTRVIFIGGDKEKEYSEKVRRLVERSHLDDIVTFLGFVSEPWKLVGPNDILVQTSLSESIGRTTTEAMKLGIPVIASDIPGHREAFELGGGILYKSQSPEDLADKLEHALANTETLRQSTRQVQKKVLRNMSEEACNRSMLQVIEKFQGQANPQGELKVIAPFLSEYITDRERTVAQQQKTITKLADYVEALRNSESYRIGQVQVRAVKRMFRSINVIRGKK